MKLQGQRENLVPGRGGTTFLSNERLCRRRSPRGDRRGEKPALSIDRRSQRDGKDRTPEN